MKHVEYLLDYINEDRKFCGNCSLFVRFKVDFK